jgi:glycopeptide antibiotics resistance protein
MYAQHPLPWVIPGTLLFMLVGIVVGRPLARGLRSSPFVAWLLVVSVALIGFATLAPLYGVFEPSAVGQGSCDMSQAYLIPLRELLRPGERSLNVILFIPLGVGLGLLPRSRRTLVLVAAALVSPFLIELTQLLLPILNRGCQANDVLDNLTGLVIGFGFGMLLGAGAVRLLPDQDVPDRAVPDPGRADAGR